MTERQKLNGFFSGAESKRVNKLIYFTPGATKRLKRYIGWLRSDFPENRKEQGGLLVGRHLPRPTVGAECTEVVDVLLAKTDCRYPGYIEWSGMEEIRMQREFFHLQEELEKTDPATAAQLRIVGWWHTHPNDLPVFMSGTDRETQRLKYNRQDQFSVVLNPHSGEFRAFVGGNADEVTVVMVGGEAQTTTPKPEQKRLQLSKGARKRRKNKKAAARRRRHKKASRREER